MLLCIEWGREVTASLFFFLEDRSCKQVDILSEEKKKPIFECGLS